MDGVDPAAAGDRIGRLLDELSATLEPEALAAVTEVLGLAADLHAAGMARVLELAGGHAAGAELAEALAGDPLVASLLAGHGLANGARSDGARHVPAVEVPVQLTPRHRCDLCGVPVPPDHRHLVRLDPRGMACSCQACHLLFVHEGAGGRTHRAVPDRWETIGEPGAAWEALDVPVGVAFFLRPSVTGRVLACYPGPAGVTESQLALDAWDDVVAAHPVLATMADDVEAVLVRHGRGRSEAFVVPVDVCYELAGRLRRLWRGFDGGPDAWAAVEDVFARAHRRARVGARR